MMALTMMTKAVMTKVVTQVGHPQAGHRNHLNCLNLRLKGDNPDVDHHHDLEHNSNNNNNNRLEMICSHSILVTIQQGHLHQVQVQHL